MQLTLTPQLQHLIDEKLKTGRYQSAEDVILAGLQSLHDIEDDFQPGEMDALLALGEADIERGDILDGGEVFKAIRAGRRICRPGELEGLLAVANEEIDRGETLDGHAVLAEFREMRINASGGPA